MPLKGAMSHNDIQKTFARARHHSIFYAALASQTAFSCWGTFGKQTLRKKTIEAEDAFNSRSILQLKTRSCTTISWKKYHTFP